MKTIQHLKVAYSIEYHEDIRNVAFNFRLVANHENKSSSYIHYRVIRVTIVSEVWREDGVSMDFIIVRVYHTEFPKWTFPRKK